MNTTPEKKITLPLRIFLKYLWGYRESSVLEETEIAEMISEIDKDESFCHVQFSDFNGAELEQPKIWQTKEWKTCYLKWQMDKKRADEERHEANLLSENTERIARAMARSAEMDFNNPDIHDTFMTLARKVAKTKSQEKAGRFGVKLDLE